MRYIPLFLDYMYYKIRHNGTVETRAVYNILGVDTDGRKDLIGLYLSETEGAKFWLSVLTDLKQQDVRRVIYTTNPIEGMHRQVRKITKTKGAFTSNRRS